MGIYKAHISTETGTLGATSLLPLLTGPMKQSKCHLSSLGTIKRPLLFLTTIAALTGIHLYSWVERSKRE